MSPAPFRIISRGVSVARPLRESLREPLKAPSGGSAAEHGNVADKWKKIFIWACIPSMALCGVNVVIVGEPEPPEFKPYEHLRLRTKPFPWGDGNRSLFHNPHTNPLPDGYEH